MRSSHLLPPKLNYLVIFIAMAANIRARFDLAIIGGGIVGAATAREVLTRHPSLKVCMLEKDKELANHQSKRNSGVVHCGIYYKKGSLKSRFCTKGARRIKQYCLDNNLPYKQCGKLIVATTNEQLQNLSNLHRNALDNDIEDIEIVSSKRVEQIQPGCTRALEAIWSPNTAIVDWQKVAWSFAQEFENRGGEILSPFFVDRLLPSEESGGSVLLRDLNTEEFIAAKSVVNCAGLYSDVFARMTGNNEHPKVVPFKGNYFILDERLASTIKTNVYPVPDPKLPFLGVHITPRIDGTVLVGPTSLLTIGYEKYDQTVPPRLVEMYHILIRSGVRKMLRRKDYFKAGVSELLKYFSKQRVVSEVGQFLPEIRGVDLIDTNFCGIRAQVMSKDGRLIDDFLFESGRKEQFSKVLHLRNCPSPAATSSMTIAERVVNILEERLS